MKMELLIGFAIAVWLLFALAEDETLEDFARREARKHGKRTNVHSC